MKATIEQLLKPVIKEDIQSLLSAYAANSNTEEYSLKVANDIRHQDKEDNMFTISAVITTGDDRPNGTKDVMAWNKSLMMIFRVPVNYIQEFAGIIKDYCDATWDRVSTVTDTRDTEPAEADIAYQYRFTWLSAKPQGEPYSTIVKALPGNDYTEESLMVREFVVIGSMFYSSNVPMDDQAFSVALQIGTEPDLDTRVWLNAIEDDWNEAVGELKLSNIYQTNLSMLTTWLSGHPATNYPVGTVLKATLTESSTIVYKIVGTTGTQPHFEYIPLLGRFDDQAIIQPAFTPTKLVDQDTPEYDLDAVNRSKSFSVYRILNDVLHNHLLSLFYTSDTASKFDCIIKMTVASLSITKYYNAKITNISYKGTPNEIISFSVIILDEIAGA